MLRLVSGGAAQALIKALETELKTVTADGFDARFGAVGTMATAIREGAEIDLAILTPSVLSSLAADGRIDPATITDIGPVATAIAVRTGDAAPAVGDVDALREAFRAADAIFLPDIVASTAGIHAIGVIERLGIRGEVEARLRVHPNGATAMRELAASTAKRPIGCTQTTEIVSTPGLTLVAPLPPGTDLVTVYQAAVLTRSTRTAEARRAITLLAASEHAGLRARLGFG
jgi:molybdate transport system substrate-binding protein